MSESQVTVTVDSKFGPTFSLVGAAVGLGVSLLVGPVVAWLLNRIETAPAPLRLIDQLPLVWSAPLLTILGAVAGWIAFSLWNEEAGRVTIDQHRVQLETKGSTAVYRRGEIAEVFLDQDELVLVDSRLLELSRTTSDGALAEKLAQGFTTFGYPWAGTQDPHEEDFVDWVDRSPELPESSHRLLRARRRALSDNKSGEAESMRDELAQRGLVVRDRQRTQQYRLVAQR